MNKLKIVLLGIMVLSGLVLLTGCTTNDVTVQTAYSGGKENTYTNRFVKIDSEPNFDVIYDKETKVMYTVSNCYRNSGNVTLLVDAEGKPLLYQK